MATVQITIPDAVATRVANAFAGTFSDDFAASGLTKPQYTKQALMNYIKQVTAAYEGNQAGDQAKNQAVAQAQIDIIPT